MRYLLKLGLYVHRLGRPDAELPDPRSMPGDPVRVLIAGSEGQIEPEAAEAIAAQFGMTDDPLIIQYGRYLADLVNLDLGTSLSNYPVPVIDIISGRCPGPSCWWASPP